MSRKIIEHFKKRDPKFYAVMMQVYAVYGDDLFGVSKKEFLYDSLVESIVSQQLSVKASDAIFQRILNLLPGKKLLPENLLKIKDEDLRKAGLSFGKIKYLKDLSEKVKSGDLDLNSLEKLENEEVIRELIKVKGIGRWTAEMFLMSALGRADIFSHGDLGLKNAVKKIYGLEKYEVEVVEKIVVKWSPFRTTAAKILWRSLELK